MINKSAIRFLGKCFLAALMLVWPVLSHAQEAVKIMKWTVDDTLRQAMVYLPATAKSKDNPVIFVFHGHGGTMGNMYRSRSFEKLWPEAIIVYPQGLNTPGQLTDPNGRLPGWQKAPGDMGDRDLHFFDAMLKTLRQDYKVDNKRIYATGHSNGGGFTYLLWAMRGDTMHIMGEQDNLVKPAWQKAMCNKILQVNDCSDKGQPYDQYATLYPSATQTPVVLYVHPGAHVYPAAADKVVIKFLKSMVKL